MRTALEMADFIIGYTEDPEEIDRWVERRIKFLQGLREEVIRKGRDPDDLLHIPARRISSEYIPKSCLAYDNALEVVKAEIAKRAKYRPYCTSLFHPIERALGPNIGLAPGGDNDVLYAIIASGLGLAKSSREYLSSMFKPNLVAAFTANRCIIAHTDRKGREMVETILYDDITGIEPTYTSQNAVDGILLNTTITNIHFASCALNFKELIGSDTGRSITLGKFDPNEAYEIIRELVMKYKQAKYAAQQGTAAPQQPQQTPPPPQETSQWAESQRDMAQQTAARLTAALQAPSSPAAPQAAPAAPSAGAGLPAGTVEALKQLKDLLDAGILTQEEFDTKKKQLLGL